MATQNVKNNHSTPLNIGGVIIGKGATAAVPNWEGVETSHAVKSWLDSGIIELDGESPEQPAKKSKKTDKAETPEPVVITDPAPDALNTPVDPNATTPASGLPGLPGAKPSKAK